MQDLSFPTRDWTRISCTARRILKHWDTRKVLVLFVWFVGKPKEKKFVGKTKGKVKGLVLVQFSCSVVSDSLRPHELQHARPPCPSPTPGVHSDSGPSSQWCHPAISSSVRGHYFSVIPGSGQLFIDDFKASTVYCRGFPGSSVVKNLPANGRDAGDSSSIPA